MTDEQAPDTSPDESAQVLRGRGGRRQGGPGGKRDKLRAASDAPFKSPAGIRMAAMAAHARADYDSALAFWAEFRRQAPDKDDGFASAIHSAKAAGRDDLVQTLLHEGIARFPDEAESLREEAEAPSWEAADASWSTLITAPPSNRKAELAAALSPLKQKAAGKWRFRVMLSRIEAVEERYPDYAKACTAHLSVLRRMERFEKAAKLARKFRKHFPDDLKLALSHIAILDAQKDYDAALKIINGLRKDAKPSAAIEIIYIQALSRLGRLDDADAACAQAVAAFPDNAGLMREYAVLATRRGDWTEALQRWQAASVASPDSRKIKKGLEAVRLQLADQQLPGSETQQGDTGRFFARFESLGGSKGGCEFGMVQRKFGSTSLGLLRWSNIRIEAIIEGMRNGFLGLGEVANTQLKIFRPTPDREEYVVWDVKYGLGAHTFIEVKDAPEDKMLLQTAKRLTYLRGKLLEELGTAKKIFVYKFRDAVDDEAPRALFAAMRTQGPATLLCIMKANDANLPGSVRQLESGLFLGYVGYFMSDAPGGDADGIDCKTWAAICGDVLARDETAKSVIAA
jgi:tetratricopeptide (TPR) repeat protein